MAEMIPRRQAGGDYGFFVPDPDTDGRATWVSVDDFAITAGPDPALILTRRRRPPHAGRWSMPGVLLDTEHRETVAQAALRALRTRAECEPVIDAAPTAAVVVSDPHRDERGHTVSLINVVRASPVLVDGQAGGAADLLLVRSTDAVPDLPFGHGAMIRDTAATVSRRLLTDPATAEAILGGDLGCTAQDVSALTELLYHLSEGTGAAPIAVPAMRRRLERNSLFTAVGTTHARTRPVTVFRVTTS